MGGFLFEKLVVYQQAVGFADRISALADTFPRTGLALADQLRRAAISIPANIAEGNGRHQPRDRRVFLYVARGSACECVPLLELCARRGLINADEHEQLRQVLASVARMLTALAASGPDRRARAE